LQEKHGEHFKVYNLCSERNYDPSLFNGRVEYFPFDDHNAPPFQMIFDLCENVSMWLDANELNVAVLHCKVFSNLCTSRAPLLLPISTDDRFAICMLGFYSISGW
jgi:hypothetical protein